MMDPTLPATLHRPDGPIAGEPASVTFQDRVMRIAALGQAKAVPYEQVSLRQGGHNRQQWQFDWTESDGKWQVAVAGDQAKALAKEPPSGLMRHLADLRKTGVKRRGRATLGWTLLALFLLLPLILLGLLFWQGDWIAGKIIEHVPVEQEMSLGRQIHEMSRGNWREVSHGPALEAVKKIGAKLTAGSRYQYEWHLVDDPVMNAFAIPGGIVVVHTGLIEETDRPEELAGVLAHEVQHVEQRHSLKQLTRGLGWRAAWALTTGDLGAATTLAGDLGTLSFSRDHESEADRLGMEAMHRAGMDTQGMVDVMKKLAEQSGLEIPFLQSHPGTKDRFQALEVQARALGKGTAQALDIDWAAVKRSLAKAN